jgi:hypothetical protein
VPNSANILVDNNVTTDAANTDNLASIDNANSDISTISTTEAAELSARNAAAKIGADTAALLTVAKNAIKTLNYSLRLHRSQDK